MPRQPKKVSTDDKKVSVSGEPKVVQSEPTPVPEWEVDVHKLLWKLAQIKTKGVIGGMPNFANYIVVDCIKHQGDSLTVEQASQLINSKIQN